MGLGGGRRRVKIGNDPNNTSWSKSTDSYGHRMLLSQGWQPGTTLGAENPSYKEHLTQASKSHIRVALRDDNLGLGAKRGSGQEAGECVGLDAFQAMLGRLNGKSQDALDREQKSRDDLKRRAYVEKKGLINFVYGGRLVGDEYDEEDPEELTKGSTLPKSEQLESDTTVDRKSKKKSKKAHQLKTAESADVTELEEEAVSVKAAAKKSKKRKNLSTDEREQTTEAPSTTADAIPSGAASEDSDAALNDAKTQKARRKAEKAERRERKRLKREARVAAESGTSATGSGLEEQTASSIAVKETITVELDSSDKPFKAHVGGRHTGVRSRYIAAKRRAIMDPQALKEILMVKV